MLASKVAGSREIKPRLIESITDEKSICGIRYVKIGWKDAPFYASTWEPLHEIRKEKAYQTILRSKGLLFDEHCNKSAISDKSSHLTSKQKTNSKSRAKFSKFKKRFKKNTDDTTSHADFNLDEDSTSINDVRGHGAESREGYLTPVVKEETIKFAPYLSSKKRLTTNFYRDLVEYYRKCKGDSPPSPLTPPKVHRQVATVLLPAEKNSSGCKDISLELSKFQ